jgi:hypothetical protein
MNEVAVTCKNCGQLHNAEKNRWLMDWPFGIKGVVQYIYKFFRKVEQVVLKLNLDV